MAKWEGELEFLRNDYYAGFDIDGITWKSVEHAYQAAKTPHPNFKVDIANSPLDAARSIGKDIPLPHDWETKKVDIMEFIVRQKFFQNPCLANALLNCSDEMLIMEGYDNFWGVVSGVGENHLGKIMLSIRNEIRFLRGWEEEIDTDPVDQPDDESDDEPAGQPADEQEDDITIADLLKAIKEQREEFRLFKDKVEERLGFLSVNDINKFYQSLPRYPIIYGLNK